MRGHVLTRLSNWLTDAGWADRLGLSGLFVFAFFALLGPAGANIGIALMLAGLLLDEQARQRLAGAPLIWLAAASAVLTLASLAMAWTDGPATTQHHVEAASKLLKLWLFLLCAWHFAARPERIGLALTLTLAGFIVGRLLNPDMLRAASATFRPGYGLPTLALAEYAAIGVLSLLLCLPRWWSAGIALRVAGFIALALLAFWLVESQGRMAWLSLALLAPVLLAIRAWLTDTPHGRRRWLVGGAVAIIVIASATQIDIIRERLEVESEVASRVLSGDLEHIGYGSIGVRVHMLDYGVGKWLERPWLGWGPGALPALLSIHPEAQMHYQDLHNLYLELLVRVGMLGSLPFVIAVAVILLAGGRALRERWLPTDLALILVGGLTMHLLLALTNMRGLNVDWRHVWMLFGGALASLPLFPANLRRTIGSAPDIGPRP